MPNIPVPVSQFPDASLPLVGDEVVPIVQNGITSQTTSGAFSVFSSALAPEASISPPAGTLNDVDTLGALHLFVNTAAGPVTITGFEAPLTAGVPLLVTVIGANPLTLPNQTGSAAANQLYGIGDMQVDEGNSQMMYYSSTLSKWVMI